MAIDKTKILSGITSALGGIELSGNKKIFPLPNDLVFVIDTRDNIDKVQDLSTGKGHEPYMIEKMLLFTHENETYVEVGAHYGDFALQINRKIGAQGKIYAFEPGRNLFECFSSSIFLNGFSNIELKNLAVLDRAQEIGFSEDEEVSAMGNVARDDESYTQKIMATTLDSYFEAKESSVDIVRLDAEGSECRVLRGAQKIIKSSPDIRLFVEWQSALLDKYEDKEQQKKCLLDLVDEGFTLFDVVNFDKNCGNLNYRFTVSDLLGVEMLEFLAIKENSLNQLGFEVLNDKKDYCATNLLFASTARNNLKSMESTISQGADVNYIHTIGSEEGTALYIAVEKGLFEATATLLKFGANPEIKTTTGVAPLCMAAQNKNLPMVKLLVGNGADIEASYSNNATALYLAAHKGSIDIAKLLLEHGANKDIIVGGLNAFERSIADKHYDIAKLLADDTEVFCQAIPESVMYNDYAELCGKVESSSDGAEF